jgi:acetate kinase
VISARGGGAAPCHRTTASLRDHRAAVGVDPVVDGQRRRSNVGLGGRGEIDAVGPPRGARRRAVHALGPHRRRGAAGDRGHDRARTAAQPANLRGIRAAGAVLGAGVPQVAVFDTAFHQTLPAHAYLYAIPYQLYRRYKVRRYGFHGTSHRYVAHRWRQLTGTARERTDW